MLPNSVERKKVRKGPERSAMQASDIFPASRIDPVTAITLSDGLFYFLNISALEEAFIMHYYGGMWSVLEGDYKQT